MKKAILLITMFVSIVFLAGCDEEKPPIEVLSAVTSYGTAIKVTNLMDELKITGYTLNRGNCDDVLKTNASLKEAFDHFDKQQRTLKFAEVMLIEAKCAVKEITVFTDDNKYTFIFEKNY